MTKQIEKFPELKIPRSNKRENPVIGYAKQNICAGEIIEMHLIDGQLISDKIRFFNPDEIELINEYWIEN
jgi:hypothetical protein